MKHKVLVAYPQKCTGCRICEQWCSQTHSGQMNPAKARLAIHRIHDRAINLPVACSQCVKAPCIEACPQDCIGRNSDTFGLTLADDECIGCRICVETCVRGCIKMDAEHEVPLLCDLCDGEPQCVKQCPEGALQYVPFEQADRGFRQQAALRLAANLQTKGGTP